MAFLIGVVFAMTVCGSCSGAASAISAATMVAIAGFYIVFAIERGIGEGQHIVIAAIFTFLALLGARFNTWLIVVVNQTGFIGDDLVPTMLRD
jgi:hypothetical protein